MKNTKPIIVMTAERLASNLRAHSDALFRVPSSEQHLSAMQSIVSVALEDIARYFEQAAAAPEEAATP